MMVDFTAVPRQSFEDMKRRVFWAEDSDPAAEIFFAQKHFWDEATREFQGEQVRVWYACRLKGLQLVRVSYMYSLAQKASNVWSSIQTKQR